MFTGKKSAQIREILISESAWEEMTCLFAPSLGLLLLLPPVQKHLTVKLMPHLRFSRMPGGGFSAGTGGGNTFDGEYQRKDDDRDRLDHKDDRQD